MGLIIHLLLTSILVFCPELSRDHAFYLSVVEVNHDSDNRRTQSLFKVFCDDLEDAIHHHQKIRLPIQHADKPDHFETPIQQYFRDHFRITVNGKELSLEYVKAERENDSYWIYFELPHIQKWEQIMIFDDHFMELFPNQVNIVSIKYDNQRSFSKLTKRKKKMIWKSGS